MSDMDHTPEAGCSYQRCGVAGDEANCPFTKDNIKGYPYFTPMDIAPPPPNLCEHEWRQCIPTVGDFVELKFLLHPLPQNRENIVITSLAP